MLEIAGIVMGEYAILGDRRQVEVEEHLGFMNQPATGDDVEPALHDGLNWRQKNLQKIQWFQESPRTMTIHLL